MNQSAVKRTHRRARTLLVGLVVGLLCTAAVVARPLDASAATVGISYVTNANGNSVTEYAALADGNVTPIRTISGNLTGLHEPEGVALDAAGTLYVGNFSGNGSGVHAVTEYAAGANGNVAPIRTVGGALTGISYPAAVAVDASGTLYVANYHNPGSVVEFAAGANGNVAPTNTISGGLTGLDDPEGLTLDAAGTLYVGNSFFPGSVTEFAAGASGNVAPIRTISGNLTGLVTPFGVALDAAGTLYVANYNDASVTEYAALASGNVAPIRTLSGASTGLNNFPSGVAVDAAGTLYVTSNEPGSVTEYGAGANGNVAPGRTIKGAVTGLNEPEGVVVTLIPASTTTTVTSSRNPSTVGESVTYTATVSPTPVGGTVAFTDNGSGISGCDAVAVSVTAGRATCTVTYSSAGSHSIKASYSGDAAFQPSSGVLAQSVVAVPVPPTGAVRPGGGGPGSPWPFALIVGGVGMLGWSRKERRLSGG
jgi:6-phosphogluconolactonase (cycloisomerase 2 family)